MQGLTTYYLALSKGEFSMLIFQVAHCAVCANLLTLDYFAFSKLGYMHSYSERYFILSTEDFFISKVTFENFAGMHNY